MRAILFGSLLAVIMLGCTVGPNYQPPEAQLTQSWDKKRLEGLDADTETVTRWWTIFKDDRLDTLVHRTVRQNYQLRESRARVRIARALHEAAEREHYPSLEANAFYARTRSSENDPRGIADLAEVGLASLENNLFEGSFDARWEIDVFGGIRRNVQGSRANLQAQNARRRDLMVSLLAEVARNYVELREFQNRQRWLQRSIQAQSDLVDRMTAQVEAGLLTQEFVLEEKARLSELRSRKPNLQAGERASMHRLSVLAGTEPTVFQSLLTRRSSIKLPEGVVPLGLRSTLLRRRPDIRHAERRLAEATAEIGVATARLFPRFFLTGSTGQVSGSFSDLFSSASQAWSFGPSFEWSIFQGGRIRSQIEAAREKKKAAFARYRQTVLRVLEDVETSLVQYGRSMVALERIREKEQSRSKRFERIRSRHQTGLASEIEVLRAHSQWSASRGELVEQKSTVLINLIDLYKALGGGWKFFDSQTFTTKFSEPGDEP